MMYPGLASWAKFNRPSGTKFLNAEFSHTHLIPYFTRERQAMLPSVVRGGTNARGLERWYPRSRQNERDTPNFLHAALDRSACAPFFKERRVKFSEATELHRKSGVWGTQGRW
jgi:hypothetical protein